MDLEGRARELAARHRQEQELRDIEQKTKAEDRRREIEAARQLSRDFHALAKKYNIPSYPLYRATRDIYQAESSFLCKVWIVRPYSHHDDTTWGIAVDENGDAYYFEPFTDSKRTTIRERPRKNHQGKKYVRDTVLINSPDKSLLVKYSDPAPLDDPYVFPHWQTFIDEAAARIVGG